MTHLQHGISLPRTIRSILSSTPTSSPSTTTVQGWIKTLRHHKNVSFLELSDGSSSESLQVVLKKGIEGARLDGLHLGTAVRLNGLLKESKGNQAVELVAQDVKVTGVCDPDSYPIQNKPTPSSTLRDHHAHLRFRTSLIASTMRLRDGLMRMWGDWFETNDFTHIHTPILTSSDCEGAGEAFRVVVSDEMVSSSASPLTSTASTPSSPPTSPATTFFGSPTYLTVSSQLHLEAPTHSLSRVYTLSPTFRAEPSATSRHLAEFYMLECEMAFVESVGELMDMTELAMKGAVDGLCPGRGGEREERCRRELSIVKRSLRDEDGNLLDRSTSGLDVTPEFLTRPFGRLSYTSAIEILQSRHAEAPFVHPPVWGGGLQSEHEKYLAQREGGPVFVHDYPLSLKPFYMRQNNEDEVIPSNMKSITEERTTVACFDLLIPGIGELIGGSLREERESVLLESIDRCGLDRKSYDWYVDLRRYGGVKHGGWGMGWERFVCWITGVGNVRDVVAFPRWKGHCRY